MSFIDELKRRNVFKVGTAYLALGWIVTQVTATIAPYLRLPEWTVPMVVWVGVIGFPCALIFSWVYELTPEGLKRESEIDRAQSITHETSRRLDYLIIALLVLAIGLFAWGQLRTAPSGPPVTGPAREVAGVATSAPDAAAAASPGSDSRALEALPLPQPPAAAPIPDDKSIAVLPFADMSAAKDQEYMSDGISEELLNLLAKIPELRVIARTSSFAFKGKELEIPEIARRLGVAHVLEGSVRTAGNRVRITAQLIRASDGSHLWSETYDRTLDDIFAVQDEIAAAVVGQLRVTLLGAAPKARQADPELFARLLQARRLMSLQTQDSQGQALALLQGVLERDPRYAEAWTALARGYGASASNGWLPIAEGYGLAREAANKALAIDPDLAIAHAELASIAWNHDGSASETARHLQRALELEPGNTDVLGAAANFLLGLGRLDAAIRLATYRRDRDPVNLSTHAALGYISLYSGHPDEAIAARRVRLSLEPDAIATADHYFIGVALLLKGDTAAALAEFEQEQGPVWREVGLALGYHAAGRTEEADRELTKLVADKAESWAYQVAYIHAFRGEPDLAFDWLERAVRYKDPGLSDVAVDPLFANLHTDPRWLPFLQRIGRAPEQLAAIKLDVKLP